MSIRMGRKNRFRPEMLPFPAPTYGFGKYPERVRVGFVDGHTAVYDAPVKQPPPRFFSDQEIERMKKTEGSYQYKGARKNG